MTRLSHTRKAFAISFLLIMLGLLGQATAATTTAQPKPAPDPSAVVASGTPQSSAPAPTPAPGGSSTAEPAPAPAGPERTEKAFVDPGRTGKTGPAGSLMTTGSKAVALTFDDGPDPDYTPKLLQLLAKEKVKATFCLVGTQARRHPDLVRAIAQDGHSFCNHSWNHDLKLGKKPHNAIREDLERTNAAIRAAVPGAQIRYMRAPGGNFTPPLVNASTELGMRSIYWKVDPRDWEQPETETDAAHRNKVIRIVKSNTRAGSIVLSHDYAQPETVEAYRVLLPWLRKRFELVALP
ncbi:polysaccharide deacetylase family protein [Actinoplanes sp. NEAU-A12]|uniref:Polysaccharide deacetylase family protein n=1 Tax=Actinoplanes sandaracinus TaxID=3045177 RepID=A0ABT6WF06_9ACTN|nr:polysaccharide deacetylase family protein [Actinoplanes sandaracinus]MDI6098322.1 polysaccharide deacetylase family protein [Actinoplanes sandaracinus]